MAFVTGTANSMAALLTALQTACTANGWTLAGNVLSKDGCYAQIRVVTGPVPSVRPSVGTRDYLYVKSGNGIDGSNLLTDPAGNEPTIGTFLSGNNASNLAYEDWVFPVTYRIHINTAPDEVWMAVRWNPVQYMHLAFGKSPAVGCPGTGNWHFATLPPMPSAGNIPAYYGRTQIEIGAGAISMGFNAGENIIPQPFWIGGRAGGTDTPTASTLVNYSFHGMRGDTGAAAWSSAGNGFGLSYIAPATGVSAWPTQDPLLSLQPNAWNSEAAFIRLQLLVRRPDSKTSLVGDIEHTRILRIDHLDPEYIEDRDPDYWCIYPCLSKNTAIPAGGTGMDMHSGCFGIAVRYDGPLP